MLCQLLTEKKHHLASLPHKYFLFTRGKKSTLKVKINQTQWWMLPMQQCITLRKLIWNCPRWCTAGCLSARRFSRTCQNGDVISRFFSESTALFCPWHAAQQHDEAAGWRIHISAIIHAEKYSIVCNCSWLVFLIR